MADGRFQLSSIAQQNDGRIDRLQSHGQKQPKQKPSKSAKYWTKPTKKSSNRSQNQRTPNLGEITLQILHLDVKIHRNNGEVGERPNMAADLRRVSHSICAHNVNYYCKWFTISLLINPFGHKRAVKYWRQTRSLVFFNFQSAATKNSYQVLEATLNPLPVCPEYTRQKYVLNGKNERAQG